MDVRKASSSRVYHEERRNRAPGKYGLSYGQQGLDWHGVTDASTKPRKKRTSTRPVKFWTAAVLVDKIPQIIIHVGCLVVSRDYLEIG